MKKTLPRLRIEEETFEKGHSENFILLVGQGKVKILPIFSPESE
jgi:hypothetical protein